jgi:hypothetical protein
VYAAYSQAGGEHPGKTNQLKNHPRPKKYRREKEHDEAHRSRRPSNREPDPIDLSDPRLHQSRGGELSQSKGESHTQPEPLSTWMYVIRD